MTSNEFAFLKLHYDYDVKADVEFNVRTNAETLGCLQMNLIEFSKNYILV